MSFRHGFLFASLLGGALLVGFITLLF